MKCLKEAVSLMAMGVLSVFSACAAFGGGVETRSGKVVQDGITWNVQYGPWGNGCVLNGTTGGTLSGDVTLPSELPCPFDDAIDSFMRVGRLGDLAFRSSPGLTSVTIPEAVEAIGSDVFAECTSLKRLVLAEGLREIGGGAFSKCTALEEIVIPDSVVRIASKAFQGCTSLKRVDLGAGKLEIGDEAFAECSSLETVTGGTNVTRVLRSAFDKTPFLGSSSDEEFSYVIVGSILIGCRGRPPCTESTVDILTTRYDYHPIVIPEGVTEIAAGALAYSMSFATRDSRHDVVYPKLLKLPSTLRKIGAFAFCSVGFDSITTVEGGDNVTSVGTHVFSYSSVFLGCDWDGRLSASGLARIGKVLLGVRGIPPRDLVIPEGVESIAPDAFRYDSPEDRHVLKGNLYRVGLEHEEGAFFDDDYRGCDQIARYTNGFAKGWLSSVCFAGTCKTIGVRAFIHCPYLKSVDLTGVEDIGEKAFSGGSQLRSVSHADGIVSVGKEAFSGCPLADWGLEGEGALRSIGDEAFAGCALTAPVMLTEGVTNVGDRAFVACESMCGFVHLPSTLTEVPSDLFGHTRVSGFSFPEGCKSVGTIDDMDIEELIVPPGVVTFGGVSDCKKLRRVVLPETLQSIGPNGVSAFYGCPALEYFEVSGRPSYPGQEAPINRWTGCTNLTKVVLHPNPDEDTCYEPGRFKTYLCEGGEVVVTPSWSIQPEPGTQSACVVGTPDAVGALVIPALTRPRYLGEDYVVDSLAPGLFKGQAALTEITFPWGIQNIPDDAFEGCTGLVRVHAPGWVMPTVRKALKAAGLDVDAIAFDELPGLEYGYDDDRQSVVIRGIEVEGEDGFVVPDTVDGLPVLSVSGGTHSYRCEGTLVLPDALEVIHWGSMNFLEGTTCLKIGAALCQIGKYALTSTYSLESFDVSPDNAFFKSVDGCLLSKDGLTFYRCPGARSGAFAVPEGVRYIADGAFAGCSDLTRISLPSTLASVSALAFEDCSSLAAFEVPAGCKTFLVEDDCLYSTAGQLLAVPCAKTGKVVVREGTVELGARAFAYTGVSEVVVPEGVTNVGDSCFAYVASLALTLPSTVTTFGRSALNCPSLEVVWVPASRLDLVKSALKSSYMDVDRIVILEPGEPVVMQWITEDDGHGGLIFKGVKPKSFGVTDLVVPAQIGGKNVTALGNDAFERASRITSLTLPDTVTSIGSWCFYGCYCMTNLVLGAGIETIGSYAFYDCIGLKTVMVPPAKLELVRNALAGSYVDVSKITFVTKWDDPVSTRYMIEFRAGDGTGAMPPLQLVPSRVYKLPPCTLTPRITTKRFAGWACSNGRRYDDGILVFGLAEPGETVTMTAIWE